MSHAPTEGLVSNTVKAMLLHCLHSPEAAGRA